MFLRLFYDYMMEKFLVDEVSGVSFPKKLTQVHNYVLRMNQLFNIFLLTILLELLPVNNSDFQQGVCIVVFFLPHVCL